jgi:hypothetical protein
MHVFIETEQFYPSFCDRKSTSSFQTLFSLENGTKESCRKEAGQGRKQFEPDQ